MTVQIEMKWQVFVIRDKGNSKHTVWQYDTLKEAAKQYGYIDPKSYRKELQQVLVLMKKDIQK